jgi:hypothetical protein
MNSSFGRVAMVETLQPITGYQKLLPGTSADAEGRLPPLLCPFYVVGSRFSTKIYLPLNSAVLADN